MASEPRAAAGKAPGADIREVYLLPEICKMTWKRAMITVKLVNVSCSRNSTYAPFPGHPALTRYFIYLILLNLSSNLRGMYLKTYLKLREITCSRLQS